MGDDELARVGEATITVQEFEAAMRRRGGEVAGAYATADQRRALLDEVVRRRILVEAAREEGYFDDPDLWRRIEDMVVARYRTDVLERRGDALNVTEEDIAARYHSATNEYRIPPQIRFAMVLVRVPRGATEEKQKALREKALQIQQEARAAGTALKGFGHLASRYSDDRATRHKNGDTGWIPLDRPPGGLSDTAFSAACALTATGRVADIVTTEEGHYLFKLLGRREGERMPLAAVGSHIRQVLENERSQAHLDVLIDEKGGVVGVEINEGALEGIQPPADQRDSVPTLPPTMPAAP